MRYIYFTEVLLLAGDPYVGVDFRHVTDLIFNDRIGLTITILLELCTVVLLPCQADSQSFLSYYGARSNN